MAQLQARGVVDQNLQLGVWKGPCIICKPKATTWSQERGGLAGRAHSDGGASGGHSRVGLLPPTDQPRHYSDTDVGPPVVMAKIRWSGHN